VSCAVLGAFPSPWRRGGATPLIKRAGSLRQATAIRAVGAVVVAKLLGHTTSRMVELVYAHLDDPSKIEAVSTLPAMPETGSKWVTKQGQFLRQKRQMRQPDSENFQLQVPMPRGGIEPPTRGFSDLKPAWPSPRVRCQKTLAREVAVAHLLQQTAPRGVEAPPLPTQPRTSPRQS
jgi:hypothetical protein